MYGIEKWNGVARKIIDSNKNNKYEEENEWKLYRGVYLNIDKNQSMNKMKIKSEFLIRLIFEKLIKFYYRISHKVKIVERNFLFP